MARPRKPKVTSIRVTTYYYTSGSSGDRKVSERVLEPETDEYLAWANVYGDGTNSKRNAKHVPPSEWWEPKAKSERKSVAVDKDTLLEIQKIMEPEFNAITAKLVQKGIIPVADKDWVKGLMLDVCRDAHHRHDPEKRSLKGFLKFIVRNWLNDFLKGHHRQKRKACLVVLEDAGNKICDDESETDEFGIKSLADPHVLAEMECQIKLHELKAMCTKRERSVLNFLLAGGTEFELSKRLKLSRRFVRHYLIRPLKCKFYECFGFPKCFGEREMDS